MLDISDEEHKYDVALTPAEVMDIYTEEVEPTQTHYQTIVPQQSEIPDTLPADVPSAASYSGVMTQAMINKEPGRQIIQNAYSQHLTAWRSTLESFDQSPSWTGGMIQMANDIYSMIQMRIYTGEDLYNHLRLTLNQIVASFIDYESPFAVVEYVTQTLNNLGRTGRDPTKSFIYWLHEDIKRICQVPSYTVMDFVGDVLYHGTA